MSSRRRRRTKNRGLLFKAPWQVSALVSAVASTAAYFHTEVADAVSTHIATLAATEPFTYNRLLKTTLNPVLDMGLLVFGTVAGIAAGIMAISKLAGSTKTKRERTKLLEATQQAARNNRTLDQLEWREFEFLVGQVFREQGYKVSEGKGIQDGGVDITLVRDKQRLLVQCKHWKTTTVGVSVIRELAGVVLLNKADGGVVVCSGRYTKDAQEEAQKLGIHLVTGNDLLQHIEALER